MGDINRPIYGASQVHLDYEVYKELVRKAEQVDKLRQDNIDTHAQLSQALEQTKQLKRALNEKETQISKLVHVGVDLSIQRDEAQRTGITVSERLYQTEQELADLNTYVNAAKDEFNDMQDVCRSPFLIENIKSLIHAWRTQRNTIEKHITKTGVMRAHDFFAADEPYASILCQPEQKPPQKFWKLVSAWMQCPCGRRRNIALDELKRLKGVLQCNFCGDIHDTKFFSTKAQNQNFGPVCDSTRCR